MRVRWMRKLEGTVSIERISVTLLLLLHGKRFAQGEILSCADI